MFHSNKAKKNEAAPGFREPPLRLLTALSRCAGCVQLTVLVHTEPWPSAGVSHRGSGPREPRGVG
jgi:hypothetical protein